MTNAQNYLSEYNPLWPCWFAEIEMYLLENLSGFQRIEHVGSTSVTGMVAKPIIDIDVVVAIGRMESLIEALDKIGYGHQGDLGIAGREAFRLDGKDVRSLPAHHLYACEEGSYELMKHLSFRDYLRTFPAEAKRLADEKRRLAFHDGLSRADYIMAKVPLVEEILRCALNWSAKAARAEIS